MGVEEYDWHRIARVRRVRATGLGIDWPIEGEPVLSERDAGAPSLEQVRAAGLLPTWEDTRAFVDELRARVRG